MYFCHGLSLPYFFPLAVAELTRRTVTLRLLFSSLPLQRDDFDKRRATLRPYVCDSP